VKLFAVGDRVSQSTYGAGTITLVNEHHIVVDFDEHGTRRFVTSLVRLEPSDTVAPVRPKRASRKTSPRRADA
jgi:hypothetical protein